MLQVHRSNRLEALADALAETLAGPTDDPLAPDVVVVHSTGMERWVAMQLAQRAGICANVAFRFPGDLVEEILSAALDADPSGWAQDRLAWHIAAALPVLVDEPAFATIRAHLHAGGAPADAMLALSSRLAGLFERYATYRPDLARAWSGGAGEGWQPRLWHAVGATAGPHLPHLADRLEEAILRAPLPPEIPPRIALFSPGTLAPLVVDVISAVSRVREVHLFVLSASEAAWERNRALARPGARTARSAAFADDPALLVALGRLGRDLQVVAQTAAPAPVERPPRWVDPGGDTLLHALQSDLLHGRRRGPGQPALDLPADGSIEIHSAHGAYRQIEVLRDALVRLLDADPTLEPRDIVVMSPDVDTYGPLVEAVFSDGAAPGEAHPSGMPRLPFAIGDRGAATENPAASALLGLLEVAREGRFEASVVLDLLALAPVRQRFGVDPGRLPDLRAWARDAGIRWGRDAAHRVAWHQPDRPRFTWRFGLDRLLIGQAMGTDEGVPRDKGGPLVPVPAVDGREARAALGGLADLADALFALHAEVASPRPMAAWADVLLAAVDRFVLLPDRQAGLVRLVREAIERLRDASTAAGHDAAIGLSAVQELLEGRFGLREPGRAFLGGAITICELVPMRSIPFRVVCLVGMDEGAFPRDVAPASFDLVAAEPRIGDRTPRDDDRGLLLETLLAARERLIVTYGGHDLHDGDERPPCVPVAEILDVVEDTFGKAVRERIVTTHPLQPFGPAAFDAAAPASADRRRLAAARAYLAGRVADHAPPRPRPATLAPEPPGPVALSDLHRALRAPCDAFARRLGLSFWEEQDVPLDREPVLVDGLGAWQLRDDLVGRILASPHADARALRPRVANDHRVPLGPAGQQAFEQAWKAAESIAAQVRARLDGPARRVDLDLDVGGRAAHGRVHDLGADGVVRWSAGKVKAAAVLGLWVDLLALKAAGAGAAWGVLVGHGSSPVHLVAPEDAMARLADLIALRDEALTRPLPFLPEPARGWAQAVRGGQDPELVHLQARHDWAPEGATALAFPRLPDGDEPLALALRVWGPVLEAERHG